MSAPLRLKPGVWPAEPLSPEAAQQFLADAAARADEVRRTGLAFRRAGWIAGAFGALLGLAGVGVAATVVLRAEPARLDFALLDRETGEVSPTLAARDAPRAFTDHTARQYLRRFVEACDGYAPTPNPTTLQRDLHRCAILLTEPMQERFRASVARSNPESPLATLGRSGVRTTEGFRYFKYPSEGRTQTWRVQYTRVETRVGAGGPGVTTRTPMTAMVNFQWRPELPQLAEDRDWNTAGMQVVTYSIEPDTGR
ncbi:MULTISPECIES: type IV secretion system protein [Roseomonadaceae]|uniref:Type IV secretion system protein n=1 Tax=Roseicella aerolata TaxID=2883479 RepID=A0A9X1L9W2_9PROT|nr:MULTISPECIES: type IV secretion system protein [Acetobacteraceae]MCB4824169.1 type IV secretion system protein [Roseicella aerolata]MDT8315411.1 type IV secretion system protein [Roseomonas mucosa]MDT8361672.1 type IV secretion system protein [Roseomonas mucosa]